MFAKLIKHTHTQLLHFISSSFSLSLFFLLLFLSQFFFIILLVPFVPVYLSICSWCWHTLFNKTFVRMSLSICITQLAFLSLSLSVLERFSSSEKKKKKKKTKKIVTRREAQQTGRASIANFSSAFPPVGSEERRGYILFLR